MLTDTIAAIATAMSNSGIGIVRISGKDAFSIIDRVYKPKNGTKILSQEKSHTIHYGFIYDDEQIIDEVMVILLRGPHSYTAEDTVEIDCHGGILVMQRILQTVINHGARLAEPGEFTKRAFLNGRIDLSQAESVMDVIQSKNQYALNSSMKQLQGALSNKIKNIRAMLLHELAFIESALDDPEHYDLDGYKDQLRPVMEETSRQVEKLLATAENGMLLKEGIHTVIVGKPNAGKSSLMNCLLRRERSIVTDIPGTTRDALEEQITLGGFTLHVVDTAGIRDTDDIVEKIGVDRTKEYLLNADLIIYVVDASVPLDDNDREIIELLTGKKTITLLNKTDLKMVVEEQELIQQISSSVIYFSALNGIGLDILEEEIRDLCFKGISFNDQVFVTNLRQKTALQETLSSLHLVQDSIVAGLPEDFYSIDLMNAYETLGTIIGESVGDDLVIEIFSKFCMGK